MKEILSIRLFQQKKHIDMWVLGLMIFFIAFGLLMIFESSNFSAFNNFGDQYHFVRDQLEYFFIGSVLMITAIFIPYKKYYRWSFLLLIINIFLLIAVFIPGIGIRALGAHRWLSIGIFNFQPAELTKLTLIFYLAAWFSSREKGRLVPFLLLLLLVVGLVIIQPDLGTATIITLIALVIYFLSRAPIWHFLMVMPIVILLTLVLAVSSPYRLARLTSFLNPNTDPLGTSYHIRQILISLGSGGMFGIGLGASRQKYQYLPEATTDSIFAIIGEEFGYLGGIIFISAYLYFLYRIFIIAKKAPDQHGFLLASGVLSFFGMQAGINLAAIAALLPLTGVPLPFVSYGGSNLIVSMIAVGIVLNISRYQIPKK